MLNAWWTRREVVISGSQHRPGDAESLARKLRTLESQLSANERRLLTSILAAAALSGIVLGVADSADSAGGAGHPETVAAAEHLDGLRAQFLDAYTPGAAWNTPSGSIKPPR